MKRIVLRLSIALILSLAGAVAQAQTTCTGPVAQIISPTPGSTLPAGAVTFAWCHANGDYFLDIESVPGAHDIFFAFLTVESVTLGPACNIPNPISPTTQCIPPNGETIYVTLWTNIAQSGRRNYVAAPTLTFTAASSNPTPVPVVTTTTVGNQSVTSSSSPESVTLTAAVAAASTVNQGTVTFQVMDGSTNIGTDVPSTALTNGSASVIYALPAGLAAKDYTIDAAYSGGDNFQPSIGNGTLTITNAGFSLGFDSPTITATRGTKAKVIVNINRTGGFIGNVTVTPPDVSGEGIIVKSPDPIQTSDPSVSWKLKIKTRAAPGPHVLTFTGTDGSGNVRTAAVTLVLE